MAPQSIRAKDGKNYRKPMQADYCREFVLEDRALRTWLYAASLKNHSNCLAKNLEISPETPVPYVFQIES
jgi:hypothetical protein